MFLADACDCSLEANQSINQTQELSQKCVTAVSFGMAVDFMMFIKELRKNGDEISATPKNAICRRFLPFLAELDIFESFEAILFFFSKK